MSSGKTASGAYVTGSVYHALARAVVPFAWICIGVALVARLAIGVDRPFWLDESWTGAIVQQSSFKDFFALVRADVNAPLYYFLSYGWAQVFGLSDISLRLMSLLFSAGVPFLVLVFPCVACPARRA